jgi:hypothetical protein
LPGVIFHPPDATVLIEQIVRSGRQRGMPRGSLSTREDSHGG